MIKLAVITHTNESNKTNPFYDAAMQSIAAQLPACAEHKIIICNSHDELSSARWACMDIAEYICFVDDDDIVMNNSIALCLEALESNRNLGVAFTNEVYIDINGEVMDNPHEVDRHLRYEQIKYSAQTIHQLVMVRTNVVDIKGKQLSEIIGTGGEWMLKGGTALKSGAIHVPIDGYGWRQYPTQNSKDKHWNAKYSRNMHLLKTYLASHTQRSGDIKRFEV